MIVAYIVVHAVVTNTTYCWREKEALKPQLVVAVEKRFPIAGRNSAALFVSTPLFFHEASLEKK